MKIKWNKENQHTAWGLFQVGETIDTEARQIPKDVVDAWIGTGWATPVKTARQEHEIDKPERAGRK